MDKRPASAPLGDIAAVAYRCEQSFHAVTALHELCDVAITNAGHDDKTVHTFVLLREVLRGLARDMENCADLLQTECSPLGYFVAHYGSV